MPINLKEAIKSSKSTQKDMADALSIDYAMISRYITGKSQPTESVLVKMADYLNVSIDYLVGRETGVESETGKIDKKLLSDIEYSLKDLQISLFELKSQLCDECVSVPLLEDTIAAGTPVPISGRSAESRFFVRSWLKRFDRPLLITVGKGQRSMMPTIHPGDLLLIDRKMVMEPLPENIYAVNAGEGGTVKRCALVNGKIKLIPDNPDYSEHIIDVNSVDISKVIVGRVVWIGREFA